MSATIVNLASKQVLFVFLATLLITLPVSSGDVPCHPNCLECDNIFQCTQCQEGKSCCDSNCITCSDDGLSCTKCNKNFEFKAEVGACVATFCVANSVFCQACKGDNCVSCTGGQYLATQANICMPCGVSECDHCSAYGVCTQCDPGFYPTNSQSKTQLNNCELCPTCCDTCDASGKCFSCSATCFLNQNKCLACEYPCETCQDDGVCLSCVTGYYPRGQQCLACSSPCKTCKLNDNVCTSCISDFILTGNICLSCYSAIPQCIQCNYSDDPVSCTVCKDGYYASKPGNQCLQCQQTCATCLSASQCLTCHPYYVESRGSCLACSTNCLECHPLPGVDLNNTCITCVAGHILTAAETDPSVMLCESCSNWATPNCMTCLPDKSCLECFPAFNLMDQQCKFAFDQGTPGWAIFITILCILMFLAMVGAGVYLYIYRKRRQPQSLLESSNSHRELD